MTPREPPMPVPTATTFDPCVGRGMQTFVVHVGVGARMEQVGVGARVGQVGVGPRVGHVRVGPRVGNVVLGVGKISEIVEVELG